MSEIQLDSAAVGPGDPDAETGKADEVSDHSEEADGFDPAGPSDDVAELGPGRSLTRPRTVLTRPRTVLTRPRTVLTRPRTC